MENKRRFYTQESLSEHMAETPEGFLICYDVPMARTGTQIYKADEVPIDPNDNGLVEIRRREEEVFNPDAIKSFEGKSLCIDHPEEMVTPDNWIDLAHGFITNVRRGIKEQADLLVADIVVTTKKAIELIKNGMRELSCGYDAEYEQLEKGIGIQKGIIGNHVALVMRGRAGSRCAIGDKECNHCGNCKNHKTQEDKDDMKIKDIRDKILQAFKDAEGIESEEEKKEAKDAEETAKVEELKALDKKTKDDEADLGAKIDKLIGIVEALVKSDKEVHESIDRAIKDEDEEEKKEIAKDKKVKDEEEKEEKKEVEDEEGDGIEKAEVKELKNLDADEEEKKEEKTEDTDEEEKEKEKMEAKDCDSCWQDVAARAEILSPGIKLVKPTKDHKKFLNQIKAKALKSALTTDSDVVSSIIKRKNPDKLSSEALDIAFDACSDAVINKNNKVVKDSIIVRDTKHLVSTIQSINDMNKKFYAKK
jgi:hypothetical protein